MGTRITGGGAERVYAAAHEWVQRALRTDDSLFTPGKAIWSRQWLGELRERWLNIPDEPSAIFSEKLQPQLEGSLPELYQLIGEARYFHLLIATTSGIEKKKQRIDEVLGWSPSPVAIPPELVAGLVLFPDRFTRI